MAKAFLLRWGYQNDFDSIKLQTRELGFSIDSEKLYIGTDDANIHIPNEAFTKALAISEVLKYKPTIGTTLELLTTQVASSLAFNSEEKRIQYKNSSGAVIKIVNMTDLPSGDAVSVVVASENIDAGDNNSVTLSDYTRPIRMIFLNGILCTNNANDAHMYTLDNINSTITIKECVAGDIIAYF